MKSAVLVVRPIVSGPPAIAEGQEAQAGSPDPPLLFGRIRDEMSLLLARP